MSKFIEEYNNVIIDLLIAHIKQQILKYFNKSNWTEYIDSLEFGQCQKIAKIVYLCCPSLIKIYSGSETFAPESIKQLNELGDHGEMVGNHYIVKIYDKFYDFGKGANTINGVYLIGTNEEKYSVEMTEQELSYFNKLMFRDPESWLHIKVSKRKIKQFNLNKK